MKKRYLEPIFAFAIVIVMVFNMIGLAIESFRYDMADLPKGEFMYSVMSPDGKNTLRLYKIDIDQVGTAIRGEVVSVDEDGEMTGRNIYWETNTDNALAGWTDENTVSINEHEVNLDGEPYDSRTQIELPEASAKNRSLTENK